MDIYYTIEEKYLQAVEELHYGEPPKSLKLLNEILAEEPLYVRAHYQIGKIYYYDIKDYQSAGYHFKLCTELEPSFPDVYFHYLNLMVFLNMEKMVAQVAAKALTVAGVQLASIYNLMALCAENNKNWNQALSYYNEALMLVTSKDKKDEVEDNISRVIFKVGRSKAYSYQLSN